jgi:hypothetical protein
VFWGVLSPICTAVVQQFEVLISAQDIRMVEERNFGDYKYPDE